MTFDMRTVKTRSGQDVVPLDGGLHLTNYDHLTQNLCRGAKIFYDLKDDDLGESVRLRVGEKPKYKTFELFDYTTTDKPKSFKQSSAEFLVATLAEQREIAAASTPKLGSAKIIKLETAGDYLARTFADRCTEIDVKIAAAASTRKLGVDMLSVYKTPAYDYAKERDQLHEAMAAAYTPLPVITNTAPEWMERVPMPERNPFDNDIRRDFGPGSGALPPVGPSGMLTPQWHMAWNGSCY